MKRQTGKGPCMGFKYDLNRFLADRAGQVPVADLTAILKSGKFHPSLQKRLEDPKRDRRMARNRKRAGQTRPIANNFARLW